MNQKYSNTPHTALRRSVERLKDFVIDEKESPKVLVKKIMELNRTGKKEEFQWRHLLFTHYIVNRDTYKIDLHWTVTNPLTGMQKTFYTKDFKGKCGNINYRTMAAVMRQSV